MAVIKGENTWITVAEADLYLAYRLTASSWFALPESASPGDKSKETLLVTAFFFLQSKYGIPASSTDDNLRIAQCELALFFCDFYEQYFQAGLLQAEGTGTLSASSASQSFRKDMDLPEFVLAPLNAFLATSRNTLVDLEP